MEPLGGKKGPVVHQMREGGPLYHSIPPWPGHSLPLHALKFRKLKIFSFMVPIKPNFFNFHQCGVCSGSERSGQWSCAMI